MSNLDEKIESINKKGTIALIELELINAKHLLSELERLITTLGDTHSDLIKLDCCLREIQVVKKLIREMEHIVEFGCLPDD